MSKMHSARLRAAAVAGLGEDSSQDRWSRWLVSSGHGNKASFEALAQEVRGGLQAHALSILHDVRDADEVVQESLFEAWRKADQYDPERGEARVWLAVIVRGRSIDLIRRSTARHAREQWVASRSRLVSSDVTADAVLLLAEREAVRFALTGLTVLERQAVRLSFYQNLTCVEAAAELGIPVPTLKSRRRDAIHRLREILVDLDR